MKSVNIFYENFDKLQSFVNKNYKFLYDKKQSSLLVQVFTGCHEKRHLSKVVAEVSKLIPHAKVIGMNTGGEIINGDIAESSTVLSFSSFYHSTVRCELFISDGQPDFELGVRIAGELDSSKAKLLLLFATGSYLNTKDILTGIQTVNPSLPVSGGNAGDECHNIHAFIAYNGKVTHEGVIGAVIESDKLQVDCYHHLGWQPIGKTMTVTKADGKRVFTIDNIPAYKIYQKYLGLEKTKEFHNSVEYPIMVQRGGVKIARVPLALYEDDSIDFAADLIEGDQVQLSFGNIGYILDNIKELCCAIRKKSAESIFIYSCACRKGFLQGSSKYEIQPLEKIAPTVGFFTSGEFFHADGTNQLLNATMSVVVLSEENEFIKSPAVEIAYAQDETNELLHKDMGVLKALTHLINTVTTELEEAQEQLKYNVIGEMAAALGHEVRNPMTTVRGYLQMFQQKPDFVDYRGQVTTMIEELDQANAIITEFLSLSKNKMVELISGNINTVLNNLFPLIQANAFQRGHDIRMELEEIPNVAFDDRELRQVIINLVYNGLEAMKSGGLLIIRTYSVGGEVILSIKDHGPGISPDILDKLGTPFVTTKDKGTGLGLSICYRIAERHGAKIDIKTSHEGTTFEVKFKHSLN